MHLRFTIRDLLWLTLVVALAVGWWLDHRRQAPLANMANAVIDSVLLQDPQFVGLQNELSRLQAIIPTNQVQSADVQAKIKQIANQLDTLRAELRPKVAAQLLILK